MYKVKRDLTYRYLFGEGFPIGKDPNEVAIPEGTVVQVYEIVDELSVMIRATQNVPFDGMTVLASDLEPVFPG